MRILTLLGAALLLAACATPEEQQRQKEAQMERKMFVYGPACVRLGYPANSDTWRSCIMNLSAQDDLQQYAYPPYYPGWGPPSRNYWGPYW